MRILSEYNHVSKSVVPVAVDPVFVHMIRYCSSLSDVRLVLVFADVKSSVVAIVRIAPLFTD